MHSRICNTPTLGVRIAGYEVEMQQYETLGYRHTGRMTKTGKGIYYYNPTAPKIWSRN